MLTVIPIRYTADFEATRAFYAGLGLHPDTPSSLNIWTRLDADAGALGIHDAAASKGRPPGMTELALATDEKLETLAARLAAKGYKPELHDEDFGRSLRLIDPDGVVVQIQEIDVEKSKRSADALAARD
jgi:hypothetical protein